MQDQEFKESAHDMPRPLNAFLIFSKRHREIVREKYPDLENRDVTKMLGRWWASLDKKAKACYTGLAKKYKEAYFSENPKFKWYKVPVPPATLRILPSRSGKSTEKRNVSSYEDDELERTNNESTELDDKKSPNEIVSEIDSKPLSMSTHGKLSYIATLNLNKSEVTSSPVEDKSYNSLDSPKCNREDSVQELQNALTETTRIFEDDFEGKERLQRDGVVNDQMTNQDVIDQTVDNRFSKDDDGYKKNGLDVKKRHQVVEGLIENKRKRIDSPDRSDEGNAPCSQDPGTSLEESSVTMIAESKPNDDNIQHDITIESKPNIEPNDKSTPSNNANKKFKAADFDLDLILRDLPAQSLEEFEEKKREKNRNKKKLPPEPTTGYNLRTYGSIKVKQKKQIVTTTRYVLKHKYRNKKRV